MQYSPRPLRKHKRCPADRRAFLFWSVAELAPAKAKKQK